MSEFERHPSITETGESVADGAEADRNTRREALLRMGKLAAYTAPALLAMLTAAQADPCSFC